MRLQSTEDCQARKPTLILQQEVKFERRRRGILLLTQPGRFSTNRPGHPAVYVEVVHLYEQAESWSISPCLQFEFKLRPIWPPPVRLGLAGAASPREGAKPAARGSAAADADARKDRRDGMWSSSDADQRLCERSRLCGVSAERTRCCRAPAPFSAGQKGRS